ncbi:MAG: hypothetical protein AB7V42_05075 [Thermoleophilia bacterium]
MRPLRMSVAGAVALLALGTTIAAAAPSAANGGDVQILGKGVPTPTSFASTGRTTFVGSAGSDPEGAPKAGGVYVITRSGAKRVPGSPNAVNGLAWSDGTLYGTGGAGYGKKGSTIWAWTGWNGTRFTSAKRIYTVPKATTGLNGIAVGPDGRLYAGISLSLAKKADHAAGTGPYANDVISLTTAGRDVKVVATGLRNPWQLAFGEGEEAPYVTVLGQENLGRSQPPDYVVTAAAGDRYGFPKCNWSDEAACAGFTKPFALLPAHSSPMGVGVIGDQVYVALFNGLKGKPEVVTIPSAGGEPKSFIAGFAAPIIALGTANGGVDVGDATGTIYRVKVAAAS